MEVKKYSSINYTVLCLMIMFQTQSCPGTQSIESSYVPSPHQGQEMKHASNNEMKTSHPVELLGIFKEWPDFRDMHLPVRCCAFLGLLFFSYSFPFLVLGIMTGYQKFIGYFTNRRIKGACQRWQSRKIECTWALDIVNQKQQTNTKKGLGCNWKSKHLFEQRVVSGRHRW